MASDRWRSVSVFKQRITKDRDGIRAKTGRGDPEDLVSSLDLAGMASRRRIAGEFLTS